MDDHIDRNFDDYYPPRPRSQEPSGPESGGFDLDWVLGTMLPIWAVAIVVFLWRTATGTAPYHDGQQPSGLWDMLYAFGALGTGVLAVLLLVFLVVLAVVRLRRHG